MLPVVALTGRPNTGKSTLFNRLAGKREALVADYPGLTRDRRHCLASLAGRRVILVDTPGVGEGGDWDEALRGQFERALAESDPCRPADRRAPGTLSGRRGGGGMDARGRPCRDPRRQQERGTTAGNQRGGVSCPGHTRSSCHIGASGRRGGGACRHGGALSARQRGNSGGRPGAHPDRDHRSPQRGKIDPGEPLPGRGAHACAGPGRHHAR